jgi:hypothetical protein
MKKLLLLIAFAPLFKAPAQTSVYHHFPASNATWNCHIMQPCWFGGWIDIDYSLTLTGDTLINSQQYHKLHTPFIQHNTNTNCNYQPPVGYRGGMREDTVAHKLYYIAPTQNTEQLYFDYSWQVGDSITGALRAIVTDPDTVIAIDSVQVGSSYRKRWYINQPYAVYVIEGVGSTFGLVEPSPGDFTDFPQYTLTCYSEYNQTLYPSSLPNCNLITATPQLSNAAPEVLVFPNPNAGTFTVDLRKAGTIKRAALYDLHGKRINDQAVNGKNVLQFENLDNGIYLLVLEDEAGSRHTYKVSSCR